MFISRVIDMKRRSPFYQLPSAAGLGKVTGDGSFQLTPTDDFSDDSPIQPTPIKNVVEDDQFVGDGQLDNPDAMVEVVNSPSGEENSQSSIDSQFDDGFKKASRGYLSHSGPSISKYSSSFSKILPSFYKRSLRRKMPWSRRSSMQKSEVTVKFRNKYLAEFFKPVRIMKGLKKVIDRLKRLL